MHLSRALHCCAAGEVYRLVAAEVADILHSTAAVVADCTAGNSCLGRLQLGHTEAAAGTAGSSQHLQQVRRSRILAAEHMQPAGHILAGLADHLVLERLGA